MDISFRSSKRCSKGQQACVHFTCQSPLVAAFYPSTDIMTRTEVYLMQYLNVRDEAREPEGLHGMTTAQSQNEQSENNSQVAAQDATSTSPTEARPLSPPPVYLHRYSPSNRSLYERPASFNSTPSIASVPRSVVSLPPYAGPAPPQPPPAAYPAYNPPNNATTAPSAVGPTAPSAPQRNRIAFRLTYIRPWHRPELVVALTLSVVVIVLVYVYFLRLF